MPARCPGLEGRRVLVIEDEFLVAMEAEDLLEEQGCDVLLTAATVGDALKRIEAGRPELVILDRNLDGERTSAVAEELNKCGIPFVVITGYVNGISDEPEMVRAPCIQKPWIPAELIARLKQVLG